MQYDVYANPSPKSKGDFPYLVDIQSSLLSGLSTRMVAPLAALTLNRGDIPQRLCPILSVAGQDFALISYQAAPVLKTQLKKRVDNVRAHANAIVSAIDAVISGL